MVAVLKTYDPVDPQSDLDYSLDWTLWIPTDDYIINSTWAIDPLGPTLNNPTVDIAGKITTIWVDGPFILGQKYMVTNHITTFEAREDDRSIALRIKDR